ncbi:Ger(x)C family spore germination protein [Ferdinandcohnia quinoae]|uniref:Ger(X)C family spore germination protein n=1 Tax=Fredinandcohnia quinoae TaxID=2918902 RepID=A0AAW5DZV5_9BACI|nr:Ger(x)C family spore germination protein [Fredinandcohnia sp. SECRCQ15]MCH1625588.1 Ger(x)C family spore germination protein [Fredinandcohnia sp. SECRCQ15]
MKKILIFVCVVILLILTLTFGNVEEEIIDEVNIVMAIGFDKVDEGKIKGTAVIPVFKGDKSISDESFTQESVLAKEIMNVLQKKSADPLVTGALKVVLYGEDLAEKGITEYVDSLQRDASIGAKVYLGVVRDEAGKLLEQHLGNRGTGLYLSRIIEHNTKRRDVPESDLHTFLFRHYADGMDPYLPILKLIGDKAMIDGLAFFKDNKMVAELKETEMFFFKAMVENFSEGSYTLFLKDSDEYASIRRIESSRLIKVTEVSGEPKVNISIFYKGVLSEFSGIQTTEPIIKKIVNQLEETIEQKSEKMLKNFQNENIDPVGIGYMAKTGDRKFDTKKWEEDYQNIEINVKAKVVLTETGIIE